MSGINKTPRPIRGEELLDLNPKAEKRMEDETYPFTGDFEAEAKELMDKYEMQFAEASRPSEDELREKKFDAIKQLKRPRELQTIIDNSDDRDMRVAAAMRYKGMTGKFPESKKMDVLDWINLGEPNSREAAKRRNMYAELDGLNDRELKTAYKTVMANANALPDYKEAVAILYDARFNSNDEFRAGPKKKRRPGKVERIDFDDSETDTILEFQEGDVVKGKRPQPQPRDMRLASNDKRRNDSEEEVV